MFASQVLIFPVFERRSQEEFSRENLSLWMLPFSRYRILRLLTKASKKLLGKTITSRYLFIYFTRNILQLLQYHQIYFST